MPLGRVPDLVPNLGEGQLLVVLVGPPVEPILAPQIAIAQEWFGLGFIDRADEDYGIQEGSA